jgi:hypothetical protein
MITVKDLKAERKPNACKDEHGRLRVGAAVGAGAGNEERVDALVAAGVDVLLIDSSTAILKAFCSAFVKPVLNILTCKSSAVTWLPAPARVPWLKRAWRGESRYRPGSICTTRIVTGVGVRRSPPSPTRLKRWKVPAFRLSPMAVSVFRRYRQSDRCWRGCRDGRLHAGGYRRVPG